MPRCRRVVLASVIASSLLVVGAPARAQGPSEPPPAPVPAPASAPAPVPAPSAAPAPAPTADLPPAPPAPARPPSTPDPHELPPGPDEPKRAPLPPVLRGAIGLDTSSYTSGSDAFTVITMRLHATVPVTERFFVGVRLPLALTIDRDTDATLGNMMLGGHGLVQVAGSTWLSVGAGVGLPLLSGRTHDTASYSTAQAPNALWNIHEYLPSTLPIEARVGVESHHGPFELRADLTPVVALPVGRNKEVEVVLQHGTEAQIGHEVGAGFRFQGVLIPTAENLEYTSVAERSLYQMAVEPYFTVQRPRYYLRAGCLLPLDAPLGFGGAELVYGARVALGVHLD